MGLPFEYDVIRQLFIDKKFVGKNIIAAVSTGYLESSSTITSFALFASHAKKGVAYCHFSRTDHVTRGRVPKANKVVEIGTSGNSNSMTCGLSSASSTGSKSSKRKSRRKENADPAASRVVGCETVSEEVDVIADSF